MTIRTFWTLFIKILGIWLVLECFSIVPQFLISLVSIEKNDDLLTAAMWLGALFVNLIFYLIVLRVFLFQADWIIDLLRLDKHFKEERINLTLNANTVLRMATIIIGGLMVADSLPAFSKQLFTMYQEKTFLNENPNVGLAIFYIVKAIIGFVLMLNNKSIVAFIEQKSSEEN